MDWLRGVRRLGWGSRFRLLICVAGSGVVFEDRFFSFLQEQDFNGSMVAFFGCVHVSSIPFYLGVFARRIYDLFYKFAEMNIWV